MLRVVFMVIGFVIACFGMATGRKYVAWCGAIMILIGIAVPL